MSYPDKEQRKTCWDSRDRYWECLDKQNVKDSSERPKVCSDLRKIFEKSCPTQWVTHFDRKRDFNVFKEKMQKEGYEPIKETQHLSTTIYGHTMDKLDEIAAKLNIPTNELKLELIQEVLLKAKKNSRSSESKLSLWNEVSDTLWLHLQIGLIQFDDQLLCATCFYTVLILTEKQEFYFNEVLAIFNEEITMREHDNKETPKTNQVVSLMYGMFQSAFLIQKSTKENIPNLDQILQSTFKLLIIMAHEYSRYTFIVFKTINSFKKVCGTDLQEFLYNKVNQVKLLNLINHNWKNPITGVRDLNQDIFQTLLTVLDAHTYATISEDINGFYWNKAKYLMLSEIVKQDTGNIINLINRSNWIEGLMYSLHKPGLVSAGADMYYAVFKRLKSEEEWCKIFLHDTLKILNGSSNKPIENFTNYWFLSSLKGFPKLFKILMSELENVDVFEQKLYSSLCIMKQANKLGLINKSWGSADYKEREILVLTGLEHHNSRVRMLAFDILCVSQGKSMPTNIEYKLVVNFLKYNINSDCTVLRISMLNSFSCLLTQIHILFLNNVQNSEEYVMENLRKFCLNLQELIISSLDVNGNYQRKITCIKTAKLFLTNLNEVPRKRQNQTRQTNKTIIEMFKKNGQVILIEEKFTMKLLELLNDPSEDIRENVSELLFCHYSTEMIKPQMMNHLIGCALSNIKSKFFYQIRCGESMFRLIIKILIKETYTTALFSSVEEILKFAYDELISEYKIKRSIVESIENGKQLHSFISILHGVLEVCQQNSYNIAIPKDKIFDLLEVLDGISNQFGEQDISTSSDFSKMSDMVENIILESGRGSSAENDHTKISGLHQIVLNCLWLNVKASCDLSLILIQYQKDDSQIEVCEKCLGIITQVLETCRHKGAIEAAGVSLGKGIGYLTSLPEDSKLSLLPNSLLKLKLDELISEASKMASVTRRGAGLSIMVHKIVSSDTKKGKPLFHYFVSKLLETCNKAEDIPSTLENSQNIDNEKDLPKAIYIHFLTRIVTDSSLASDMMYYSAELAELAFDNLISPHWQIRNAALQLYGALIPKLIGQKKASGTDEETVSTVACDELRSHSPKLWKYIENQLKNQTYTDKLQYHSNLVPILNMLANIARRYNFAFNVNRDSGDSLIKSLILLLDSPIYTVRRLTAKCICNIYSFEVIYEIVIIQECTTENFIHGCLMLTSKCYKLYCNKSFKIHFKNLETKFRGILNKGVHSFFCKELFENTFLKNDFFVDILKQTFSEVDCNIHAPGIHFWAKMRVQNCIKNESWIKIPQILKIVFDRKDFESYCEYLLIKIDENDVDIKSEDMLQVTDILMSFQWKFSSSLIWKIMYQISLKVELGGHVETFDIIQYIKENMVSYKLRYVIPFIARISVKGKNENDLLMISKIIYAFTDPEVTDVEMRSIAAMANNELSTAFMSLPDDVKTTAIKSAVILLQDEDEDVRNLSVHFYSNVSNRICTPHPYICLNNILDYEFLNSIMDKTGIQVLIRDLEELLSKMSNCNISVDEYNPFANDSKNIYLEAGVFRQLVSNLKNYLFVI